MLLDMRLRPFYAEDNGGSGGNTGTTETTKDKAYRNMRDKGKKEVESQSQAQLDAKTKARDKTLRDIESNLSKDIDRGLSIIDKTHSSTFNPIVGSPWTYEGYEEDKKNAKELSQRYKDLNFKRAGLKDNVVTRTDESKWHDYTKGPSSFRQKQAERRRVKEEAKKVLDSKKPAVKDKAAERINKEYAEYKDKIKQDYLKIWKKKYKTPEPIEEFTDEKKEHIYNSQEFKDYEKTKLQEFQDKYAFDWFKNTAMTGADVKDKNLTFKEKKEAELTPEEKKDAKVTITDILKKQGKAIEKLEDSPEFKKEQDEIQQAKDAWKAAKREIAKKQTPYAIRNAFLIIDVIQKSLQNIGRALPKGDYNAPYTETAMEEPELFKLWREQIEKQQDFRNKSIDAQLDTITKSIASTYGVSEDEIKRLFSTDEDLRKAIYTAELDEDMKKRSVEFIYEINKLKADKILSDDVAKVLELAYIYDHAGDLGSIRTASRKFFAKNKGGLKSLFAALKYGSKVAGGVAAILGGIASAVPVAGPVLNAIASGIKGMSFEGMTDDEILDFIWATAKKSGYSEKEVNDAFTSIESAFTKSAVELPGGGSVEFNHETGDEPEGDDVDVKDLPDVIYGPDGQPIDMRGVRGRGGSGDEGEGGDVSYAPQAKDVETPRVAELKAQELPHYGSDVPDLDLTLTTKIKNGEDTYQDYLDFVNDAQSNLPYYIDDEKMADVIYLMSGKLKRGEISDEDMQGILNDLANPQKFLDGDESYSEDARKMALRYAYSNINKNDREYRTLNNAIREVERLQKQSIYGETAKIRKDASTRANILLQSLNEYGIDDEAVRANMLLWEYTPLLQTIANGKYSDKDTLYVTTGKNGDRVFAYETEREGTEPMNVGDLRKHFTKLYFNIEPDDPLKFPGHSFNSDYASGEDLWSSNITIDDLKNPEFWTEIPEDYKKRAEREGVLAYQNYSDDKVVGTLEREFGLTRKQAKELNTYLIESIDSNSRALMDALLTTGSMNAKEKARIKKELEKKQEELKKKQEELDKANQDIDEKNKEIEDKKEQERQEFYRNEEKRQSRVATATPSGFVLNEIKVDMNTVKQKAKEGINALTNAMAATSDAATKRALREVINGMEKYAQDLELLHAYGGNVDDSNIVADSLRRITDVASKNPAVKAILKAAEWAPYIGLAIATIDLGKDFYDRWERKENFYSDLHDKAKFNVYFDKAFEDYPNAKAYYLEHMEPPHDFKSLWKLQINDLVPKYKKQESDSNYIYPNRKDTDEIYDGLRKSEMDIIRRAAEGYGDVYTKESTKDWVNPYHSSKKDILNMLGLDHISNFKDSEIKRLKSYPWLLPFMQSFTSSSTPGFRKEVCDRILRQWKDKFSTL